MLALYSRFSGHRSTRPGTHARRPAARRMASLVLAVGLLVAPGTALSSPASASPMISKARCAANRAAGRITFITGFELEATVGTIDPVAAEAQGYFKDLCLNVSIKPGTGNPSPAAQAVAAGTATIAELGGASDVITTNANGIATKAIAMYGNVNAIELITMRTITNLRQLQGKTLGYKGSMPPQISAMLVKAGVNLRKVRQVGVGYDPTILPRGQVQALTGYKSNEVPTLEADHARIRTWDPDQFGIKGTFNALVANPKFVLAHPTAVEDFLRASFKAYSFCEHSPSVCLADLAKGSQAGFDKAANLARWRVESRLVDRHQLAGKGLGAESVAQYTPELKLLRADKLIPENVNLSKVVIPRFVSAIERGSKLIWPAP
ncbi:MAG: ABC transporter substrate-binding protein [Acidimicrobiaceae bacterium]|nr:ABC transporter substrate-binding protein [Acidimicrobiaceae bacterium]